MGLFFIKLKDRFKPAWNKRDQNTRIQALKKIENPTKAFTVFLKAAYDDVKIMAFAKSGYSRPNEKVESELLKILRLTPSHIFINQQAEMDHRPVATGEFLMIIQKTLDYLGGVGWDIKKKTDTIEHVTAIVEHASEKNDYTPKDHGSSIRSENRYTLILSKNDKEIELPDLEEYHSRKQPYKIGSVYGNRTPYMKT